MRTYQAGKQLCTNVQEMANHWRRVCDKYDFTIRDVFYMDGVRGEMLDAQVLYVCESKLGCYDISLWVGSRIITCTFYAREHVYIQEQAG